MSTPLLRISFDRKPVIKDNEVQTLCTFEVMFSDLEEDNIVPRCLKSVAFVEERMTMKELGAMLVSVGQEFVAAAEDTSDNVSDDDGVVDHE